MPACDPADKRDMSVGPYPHENRRFSKRRPSEALDSNFGPVLDLSATGVRVIASKALSGVVNLSISGMGIDQALKARVVRTTKLGFRIYEVALEFINAREIAPVLDWISKWSTTRH